MFNSFIIPSFLWSRISKLCDCENEVAFFLIGSTLRNKILIYDMVEFSYEVQNRFSASSSPMQKIMLSTALLPSMKILGILHTHPFSIDKPSFSDQDLLTFHNYDFGLFILVSRSLDYVAVFLERDELSHVNLEIRPLKPDEIPVTLFWEDYKFVIPSGMSRWELEKYAPLYIGEILQKELMLCRAIVKNNRIKLVKPIFIDVLKKWLPYPVLYRLYLTEYDNLEEAILSSIRNIFNYSNCRIKLNLKERLVEIIDCEGRLI